jgi:anti-sigma B factor antagonist
MFEITWGADGQIVLAGRFDAARVDQAREFFDSVSESCVVDCSGLTAISSSGLGVLLSTERRLRDAGHGMKLVNMKPHVRTRFEVAGLDIIFDID